MATIIEFLLQIAWILMVRTPRKEICFTLICSVFVLHGVLTQRSCTIPDSNEVGRCVSINRCSSMKALLKHQPLPMQTMRFLQHLYCGNDNLIPMVCCKIRFIKSSVNDPEHFYNFSRSTSKHKRVSYGNILPQTPIRIRPYSPNELSRVSFPPIQSSFNLHSIIHPPQIPNSPFEPGRAIFPQIRTSIDSNPFKNGIFIKFPGFPATPLIPNSGFENPITPYESGVPILPPIYIPPDPVSSEYDSFIIPPRIPIPNRENPNSSNNGKLIMPIIPVPRDNNNNNYEIPPLVPVPVDPNSIIKSGGSTSPIPYINCVTPFSRPGICLKKEICPKPEWANYDAKYLENSECADINEPLVCCPLTGSVSSTSLTPVTPTQEEVPMEPSIDLVAKHRLLPKECGKFNESETVTIRVDLNHFPWLVLLSYLKEGRRRFGCGGVLISNRYVVSAAHCVAGRYIDQLGNLESIRLGEYNLSSSIDCTMPDRCSDPPLDIFVAQVTPHPSWIHCSKNQMHDIALIRLVRPVEFTEFISPICLHNDTVPLRSFHHEKRNIAGWGKTNNDTYSYTKKRALLRMDSMDRCSEYHSIPYNAELSSQFQICAEAIDFTGACSTDSGGPLMMSEGDKWFLTGVKSFGPIPCTDISWPQVFVNAVEYGPWILNNLKD